MNRLTDLEFFACVVKRGSLAAAAQELGVTPPAVSKHLAALEGRLGVRLLNRTTRRISVTHEGEMYLAEGVRLLGELDELERSVSGAKASPRGLLRVNASFGFGRRHVAPAISEFARKFPAVEVQLQLTDRAMNLAEEAFDVGIRLGGLPDARLTARRIAPNRRLLCAAPAYLREHGEPANPAQLQRHQCIVIREDEAAYGSWHWRSGSRTETAKVRGALSTNDGESALLWALKGQGIILRSQWDAAPYLRSGRLRELMKSWSAPSADVFVTFLTRDNLSAKIRGFVEFLAARFDAADRRGADEHAPW